VVTNRFPEVLKARRQARAKLVCLSVGLALLAFDSPAYSRPSRAGLKSCGRFCDSQIRPNPTSSYDGQAYGLRSGGQGPLNASGSYGAMLEGRNPVGSNGC
jgi:hypothetical protein